MLTKRAQIALGAAALSMGVPVTAQSLMPTTQTFGVGAPTTNGYYIPGAFSYNSPGTVGASPVPGVFGFPTPTVAPAPLMGPTGSPLLSPTAGVPTPIGTGIVPGAPGSYSALAGTQLPGIATVTPGVIVTNPAQPPGLTAPVIGTPLNTVGAASAANFVPMQFNSAVVPGTASSYAGTPAATLGGVPVSGLSAPSIVVPTTRVP